MRAVRLTRARTGRQATQHEEAPIFTRIRKDPFGRSMLRVLALVLVVIVAGFVAAAFDVPGVNMSTTAGVLVGAVAVVTVTLVARNAQLVKRDESDAASPEPDAR